MELIKQLLESDAFDAVRDQRDRRKGDQIGRELRTKNSHISTEYFYHPENFVAFRIKWDAQDFKKELIKKGYHEFADVKVYELGRLWVLPMKSHYLNIDQIIPDQEIEEICREHNFKIDWESFKRHHLNQK